MQIYYIAPVKPKYQELTRKEKKVLVSISAAIGICWYNVNLYAKELNIGEVKGKLSSVGMPLIELAQLFIYWITLLCALIDIAKSIKKQDVSGVVAIVIRYGSMLAAGYAMPWIWELIKSLFQ